MSLASEAGFQYQHRIVKQSLSELGEDFDSVIPKVITSTLNQETHG